MRIRDWSSDVCSSDRRSVRPRRPERGSKPPRFQVSASVAEVFHERLAELLVTVQAGLLHFRERANDLLAIATCRGRGHVVRRALDPGVQSPALPGVRPKPFEDAPLLPRRPLPLMRD